MRLLYSILLSMLLSGICFADDDNINSNTKTSFNKIHTLGGGIGMFSGRMDSDYIHGELYDEDISFSGEYFYQFHINSNWAVAAGYQDTASGFCFICGPIPEGPDTFKTNIMKVDNYYLTVQYTYPISQRWAIYSKLGVNRYDIEFDDVRYTGIVAPAVDGVGVDLAAGVGIKFQAFNGFGIGLDYKYLGADQVQTKVGVLAFSYSF
ncbi:outer membrane beta-barrel protein [Shewanella atlantica]|uniref:outer membrane beta-barrel protein n=1 Tax=Shewanella atlantica TaxID=271099 RepID=UPI003735F452